MKKKINLILHYLVLLCFFLPSAGHAQTWFPIGAKWYFDMQEMVMADARGYQLFEVVNDTVIDSKIARIIKSSGIRYFGEALKRIDTLIFYENNHKVYFWDNNRFKLIYDFSLKKGDTINLETNLDRCDSISAIIIDSTGAKKINESTIKFQLISYTLYQKESGPYKVIDTVIEKIGYEENFIYAIRRCGINDVFLSHGLRCYEDENIKYKGYQWINYHPDFPCDTLIYNSIDESNNDPKIKIYPNPTEGWCKIIAPFDNGIITIYNSFGQKVNEYFINSGISSINLSDNEAGLFYVKVFNQSITTQIFKIIKK